MAETDLLNDLLSTNPSSPATSGTVLLVRTEMKSEFKTLHTEMGQRFEKVENRLDKMDSNIELIAQQVAVLSNLERRVSVLPDLVQNVSTLTEKVSNLSVQATRSNEKINKFQNTLEQVAQQVTTLGQQVSTLVSRSQ